MSERYWEYAEEVEQGGAEQVTRPHGGLGARYVAVRHSAAFFEARAKRWRAVAIFGLSLALAATAALAVIWRG